MWRKLKENKGTMTIETELRRSEKLRCQNGNRNYKKKYNQNHKGMWQKDISSFCRKLTTVSCGSSFVNSDCLGLYSYGITRYKYHRNGQSSSCSFFLNKMLFVFLWLSCCCLCPSSCDKIRGKKSAKFLKLKD